MLENSNAIKAFVSCSLREEDKEFTDHVCDILRIHKIVPCGTVGKYCASPVNPLDSMKSNIQLADLVVICATPRYLQSDLKTGQESYGISEMVHVETGIALAHNKPVVVFVQEGTDIGKALPNITQYITLSGKKEDYKAKKPLILSLLSNAKKIVNEMNSQKAVKLVFKILLIFAALYGAYNLFFKKK